MKFYTLPSLVSLSLDKLLATGNGDVEGLTISALQAVPQQERSNLCPVTLRTP